MRMIATATIGFDHIDLDWCARNGIEVAGRRMQRPACCSGLPPCSPSLPRPGLEARRVTLGVVGVGHVGSLVKDWRRSVGFPRSLLRPPREEREHCGFLPLG